MLLLVLLWLALSVLTFLESYFVFALIVSVLARDHIEDTHELQWKGVDYRHRRIS